MSAPQAANEKVWGERSVEVEWKSGTPFMIATIYAPSARIRASKGASKKLQMIGYGWYGDRGRQKGEMTTVKGRHSKWDGKPQDQPCRVKKARPATYRPERSRGGNAGK
jgi:hypothetical protein